MQACLYATGASSSASVEQPHGWRCEVHFNLPPFYMVLTIKYRVYKSMLSFFFVVGHRPR